MSVRNILGDSPTVDILEQPANDSDLVVDLVLNDLIEAVVGGKDLQKKPDKETDIIIKEDGTEEWDSPLHVLINYVLFIFKVFKDCIFYVLFNFKVFIDRIFIGRDEETRAPSEWAAPTDQGTSLKSLRLRKLLE